MITISDNDKIDVNEIHSSAAPQHKNGIWKSLKYVHRYQESRLGKILTCDNIGERCIQVDEVHEA